MNHAFGGKTGTTNDYTDAWFIGFSPSITAGTWVGFDDRRSLGEKETGARAALPIWMNFMKVAVADRPNEQFSRANAPKRKLEVAITPPDQQPAAPAADNGDEVDENAPPPPPPQSAVPPPAPVNQPLPNDEPAPAAAPQLPAPKRPTVVPRRPNDEQQN
jgi:penicillin-binding protein 1A